MASVFSTSNLGYLSGKQCGCPREATSSDGGTRLLVPVEAVDASSYIMTVARHSRSIRRLRCELPG